MYNEDEPGAVENSAPIIEVQVICILINIQKCETYIILYLAKHK